MKALLLSECMKVLLLIVLIAASTAVGAVTYYIDADCGTPGNGTTQTCDGDADDEWAALSDITGLSAGDTVYFDSADEWTMSGSDMLILVGGVTYDGSTWGAGSRAALTVTSALSNVRIVDFRDHASSTTTFKGFELDGGGYTNSGITIGSVGAGQDLSGALKVVEDCVIHDTGQSGASDWKYGVIVGSQGVNVSDNVHILDNTIYNSSSECLGVYVSDGGNYIDNVILRGNEVYNCGLNSDAGNESSIALVGDVRNVTIEFNDLHTNTNGIVFETRNSDSPTDVTIRYNLFEGQTGAAILSPSAISDDIGGDIYGNIFLDPGSYCFVVTGTNSVTHDWKFYNNTVYDVAAGGDDCFRINSASGITFNTLEVKNNLFYMTGELAINDTQGHITSASNNHYYRSSGNLVTSDGVSYDSGDITNYDANAQTSLPGLKDTGNLPTAIAGTYGTNMAPDNDGLSVTSGNSLNNGADLGGTPYFGAINFSGGSEGYTRDSDGGVAWDIGAYEFPVIGEKVLLIIQ